MTPTPETDRTDDDDTGKAMANLIRQRDEARKDSENAKAYKRVLKVTNAVLKRERDEARGQLSAAKREAENLATSIYRAEYSNAAPNWELCDSVAGVISQIDNMYAGVRAQRDEARGQRDRLATVLQSIRDGYGGQVTDTDCNCGECEFLISIDNALQFLTPNETISNQ